MGVLEVLAAPRRVPRVGTVVSVAGSVATVDVGSSEVDAQIPSVPAFSLATSDTVYLLPIGETWLVIAHL